MEVDREAVEATLKIQEEIKAFIKKHSLRDSLDLVSRAVQFFLSCERENATVKISFREDGGVRLHFNEKDIIIEHAP